MNIESFREYCLAKKGVTESFPFDEHTLVFKVMNKMFALTGLNHDFRINLRCTPELAVELRERYDFVLPGYHMNKTNWNTVEVSDNVPDNLLKEWIDLSYKLICDSLPKKVKAELDKL